MAAHMSGFAGRILLFEWAFVCLGTAASTAQTPSFDCAHARLPDEVAICQTQELARLDSVVAAAYSYLKSSRGRPFADQIGIPFWRARQACQYNTDCIRQRQTEEISAFRAAGVPISPFDSSPSQQPVDSQYDAATELRQCVNSKDPNERIDHCSRIIGQSRGVAALTTAHNTRGLALMEVGRFVEAVQDFTFVIRYEPRVAGFYDNRQNAYRRSGQFDLALLDANMAIQLAPGYSFVYRGRANVYNDMGNFDLAIGDYNKAIELAPQDGGLFIERGKIYRGRANFDQAIADFSHALQLDQKWDVAYRERGLTYQQAEQPAKALADLDVYNRLEPGDPTVILAIQAVSSSPVVNVPGPSTPKQEEPKAPTRPISSGTGFYIATDGSVLTNAHVVKSCSEIAVSAKAGEFSTATVLATDIANDLALLRTNERPEKIAALRLMPRLGESVEAFGYPLADILATSGNFSLGNISALSGLGDDSRYLQISVPVQPGNSGGPLLDQHGNLVGVVSAKLNALNVMLQKEGDIPQNVNFAIKASVAATFLQSNNFKFTSGDSLQTMEPADLADLAKALSVFVICR
jgi:S1-C subfamily serine protease/uncharacterized protein